MFRKIIITFAIVFVFAKCPLTAQIVIDMERQGDLFAIPCKVNGLPMKLLFDTGASGVSISLTEALFMYKNGYLSDEDIGGTIYSQIANGDIVENTEITIREIEIGGLKITNIKAMVSSTMSAPLLLGQSVIQRLGPIQLDGNKLIIMTGNDPKLSETGRNVYLNMFQENEAGNYRKVIELAKYGMSRVKESEILAGIYYELGTAYHGIGKFDSACFAYRNSLKYDLQKITAYNLGVVLYEKGDKNEAYKAFGQCLNIQETDKDRHWEMACCAYMADIDYEEGRYFNAEKNANRSIMIEPSSQCYFTLAKVMEYKESYSEAIDYYKKGLAFEPYRPSNTKYYARMGYIYAFKKELTNPNEAIDCFLNALRCYEPLINATDPIVELQKSAYLSASTLAYIYRVVEENELAIQYLKKAKSINNGAFLDELDYFNMSELYRRVGDTDNQYQILVEGLKQFPNGKELLFGHAMIIGKTNLKQAIEEYKKIIAAEYYYKPKLFDYGTIYNNIAWCYFLSSEYVTALEFASKAVQLNPKHDYSWSTLGDIYFALERYQDCIDALNRCIALSDKYKKRSYELIGKSKIALGEKREGEKYLEQARSILE